MKDALAPRSQKGSVLCSTAIWSALIGIALLLVSGPGYRLGLLPLVGGLLTYVVASIAFIAAFLVGGIGLLRSGGTGGAASQALSWAAFLVGLAFTVNNGLWMRAAAASPPIHDITTDTVNPPAFVAVLPLRAQAANPPDYAGEEIARQQRAAYPDIVTLQTDAPPEEVFARAREVVERMGWALVDASEAEGRIEATDTTFWFGFKDDIVVRIEQRDGGTAVDLRSKSRVGQGDVGANARRIRVFLQRLQAAL
ncbi:MAG: DUF1499 domain-containing protein [Chromatiales bacterium]|nr:DUF1499 domain-containing protein [Chromatiales bacterium]